jgi:hypothetical protein
VTYDLYLVASQFRMCGGQGLGESKEVRDTLTVTPGEDGRTMGAFAYDFGISDTICGLRVRLGDFDRDLRRDDSHECGDRPGSIDLIPSTKTYST